MLALCPALSPTPSPAHNRGFALLESLISIVLLATAGLGMAAMNAASLRYQHSAHSTHKAAGLLADVAERMQATQAQAVLGGFDTPLNFNTPAPAPSVDCIFNPCTEAQIAQFELQAWRQRVRNTLPDGAASLSFSPGIVTSSVPVHGAYRITLVWRDVANNNPNASLLPGENDAACSAVAGLPAMQRARCITTTVGL